MRDRRPGDHTRTYILLYAFSHTYYYTTSGGALHPIIGFSQRVIDARDWKPIDLDKRSSWTYIIMRGAG